MARFKAFISYKHVTSTRFAENLELAIKAYAKPVYRPPMAVFRDDKYLRPTIDLPALIRDALERSEYLIYLASPQAAASTWVQAELEEWCSEAARCQRLVIVLTDGKILADADTKRIDWRRTDALPRSLADALEFIPLYVDLSWAQSDEQQTLLNPDYKKGINAIVAALRGVDPIELSGQEIIQHRTNIRVRNTFVGAIIGLAVLLAGAAWFAWDQMLQADARAREATSRRLAAEADRVAEGRIDTALLLMAQAYRMGDNTALRASWWRLLGSLILPAAYLPMRATEVIFHPDGRLEARGPEGSAWFALEGARWTRTRVSAAEGASGVAAPVWEWSGGCERPNCEEGDVWECAETVARIIGPYGDSDDFCSRSRVRVPDWCGGAAIEVPGFEIDARRIGASVEVETNEGRARFGCVERPQPEGGGDPRAPRPQLIAGTPPFFPDVGYERLGQGGAAVRWLSRSLDGRWLAVLRREGSPEIRRLDAEGVHRRPGVTILERPERVQAIATSADGAIALGVASAEPGENGDILFWTSQESAHDAREPDLVIHDAWRTRGRLGGVLELSRHGHRIAAGADVDVSVWDTGSGTKLDSLWIGRQAAFDAALSPDGASLVLAMRALDGALDPPPLLFRPRDTTEGMRLGDEAARALAFDPNHADTVLMAGERGIRANLIGSVGPPRSLAGDSAELLAIHPKRRLLGAGLADRSLLIRGLDEPTETFRSGRRVSPARGLAFASQGEVILRASDANLEAWEWRANTWLTIDPAAHEDVASLPDGRVLALAGGDVSIYDLMPARWLALTCDIVRRNLSREEWLAHIGEGFDYERACREYPAGDGWPRAGR